LTTGIRWTRRIFPIFHGKQISLNAIDRSGFIPSLQANVTDSFSASAGHGRPSVSNILAIAEIASYLSRNS
jgi:hypothetical protein